MSASSAAEARRYADRRPRFSLWVGIRLVITIGITASAITLTGRTVAAAPLVINHPFVSQGELVRNGNKHEGKLLMSLGILEFKGFEDEHGHYDEIPYIAGPLNEATPPKFEDGICLQTTQPAYKLTLARLSGLTLGVSGVYHRSSDKIPKECRNGSIEVGLVFIGMED